MRIAVVGAGIGGLTATAFLLRDGHDVHVFESASSLGDVGAGIQVSPNGVRILDDLGALDDLNRIGVRPSRIVIRRWDDDRELNVMPLGETAEERWGHPYFNVYRPDLISLLAALSDEATFHYASKIRDVVIDDREPTLILENGESFVADLVIGADGIHSRVRDSLHGRLPTRFRNLVAHRALVPRADVPDVPVEVTNRLGPGGHIVSYFVGKDARFLNLVCISNDPDWDVESWNEPGDPDALRNRYATWSPPIRRILDHVDRGVFRWALHDREPLSSWSHGAVTLLGDACHPMVPFMAQGACQAMEDAAALARCLRTLESTTLALTEYEHERQPRTATIQGRSFANATMFHLDDGPEQVTRDSMFTNSDAEAALGRFDWLYRP